MDYHFLMDTNNAPDWHLDYRSSASRTTQSRPLGIAAMQQLAQTFKVIDNFRELNPSRREYTRTHHLSGGHESQKRLDRSFSSAHMHRKGRARPAITRAAHIWPDQTDRAALKGEGSNSKWSDHATIELTVRFTLWFWTQ